MLRRRCIWRSCRRSMVSHSTTYNPVPSPLNSTHVSRKPWLNFVIVPSCAEVRPEERTDLFIRKLQQCSVIYDFNDASADLQEKHTKAQTLHEMLNYITEGRGVITEAIYPEVVSMVSEIHLIFRVWLRCVLRN